ncbi:MAG: succinyl-CoA synthetase subunit beta, partial [Litoreibacter sp.]|nr:succinyl-CoA synthetase subunit beta [Litoreibacter sp.]
SKELLGQYKIKVPDGRLAKTPEEAESRCREIDSERYVVKAQIGAGGRGLAGGIRFAATPSAVRDEAGKLLGKALVTEQTTAEGEVVASVFVEAAVKIADSFYIALVIDPASGQPTLLASDKGGVEFEQMTRMDPDLVGALALTGTGKKGVSSFLAERGFPKGKTDAAAELILSAQRAFSDNDMTLLEINPLVLSEDGEWIAVDAKSVLDDNALFRHPEFESFLETNDWSAAERIAHENDINLVKLDGSIGVIVNGAGLGLATNDMLVAAGGSPANFMDIRTTATSFQIAKGVELILEDPQVTAVFLNVHGGGMTVCDTVAEGVAFAYSRSERKLPIVARLAGQNSSWAERILKDRHLPFETYPDMSAAISRVVELAKSGGR